MAVRNNPINPAEAAADAVAKQPLNRRRALRVLSALAAAAAGAAALSTTRPEAASADGNEGPTTFKSTTATPPVTATSTGGALAMSVLATGNSGIYVQGDGADGYNALQGVISGSAAALIGTNNGSGPRCGRRGWQRSRYQGHEQQRPRRGGRHFWHRPRRLREQLRPWCRGRGRGRRRIA
jgi:hypothetical protein